MDAISVSAQGMDLLVAKYRNVAAQIAEDLRAMDQAVARLQSHWDGDARSAYAHAHAEWATTMASMHALIDAHARALADIRTNYEATATEVSRVWER